MRSTVWIQAKLRAAIFALLLWSGPIRCQRKPSALTAPTLVAASVAPVVAVQTGDASFQWGDAGIGAGVAFVAMMLVVGGIVLVARQRTARPSTS